ncbi:hypothetical protein MRB53_030214 [Persea americana]|uniref:Uncharacterized protein n=1 Tax=Persea americana TaxID=3435 RepID=A0ACC2KKZ7_PERAE|nr:hypothetical protein MRB53_030214 [Persea americana]
MTHNGAPIPNYYSEFTEIFQELDQLNPSNMKDPADIETRSKEIDRRRVYIFLAGLENDFDQIRGEILRMEPKPELDAAYAQIKRESDRHGTMLVSHPMPQLWSLQGPSNLSYPLRTQTLLVTGLQ